MDYNSETLSFPGMEACVKETYERTPKFHKWAFVERFGTNPMASRWVREYVKLLRSGEARLANSMMPREVWDSIAASCPTVDRLEALAEYLEKDEK